MMKILIIIGIVLFCCFLAVVGIVLFDSMDYDPAWDEWEEEDRKKHDH